MGRDDRDRPLDECGQAQADELVRLLARFDVGSIVSADVARCVDTVAPFADALGLPVREEPLLSEICYPGREEEAVAVLRSTDPDRDAVACSQGDVIPDLIERLMAEDDLDRPSRSRRPRAVHGRSRLPRTDSSTSSTSHHRGRWSARHPHN